MHYCIVSKPLANISKIDIQLFVNLSFIFILTQKTGVIGTELWIGLYSLWHIVEIHEIQIILQITLI